MPPSGYSTEQTGSLAVFLRSCASALLQEATVERISVRSKIATEIADIDAYVADNHALPPATRSALELTRSFYEEVHSLAPESPESFLRAVELVLRKISGDILSVHITPELKRRYAIARSAAE